MTFYTFILMFISLIILTYNAVMLDTIIEKGIKQFIIDLKNKFNWRK